MRRPDVKEREKERRMKENVYRRKERVERNTKLKEKKISAFAKRKYLRDTEYVGAREIFKRYLKKKYYLRRKGF